MKNFTQKFIGILVLVFTMSFTVNAQDNSGCDLVEFVSWPTNAAYGSTVSIASPNQWSFTQPGYEAVVIQGNGDQLIVEFTNLDGSYTGNGVGGYWSSVDEIASVFGRTVAPNILPRLESNEFVVNEPCFVTTSIPNPTQSVTADVLQNNDALSACVEMGDPAACEDAAGLLNFSGDPDEFLMNFDLYMCVDGDEFMCEMVIAEYFNESCSSVQSISISSGFTQADVDAAYAEGAASVTPEDGIGQDDVDAAYVDGAASVTPEDGIGQDDVDAAYADGIASVTPEDGIGQADVDAAYEAGVQYGQIDGHSMGYASGYDEGAASVTPEDGVSQEDVDAAYAAGVASVEIPECEEVATQNIPLDLPEGWSMFGYTCLESLDVVEAFSGVSDNIEIIKDEWGLAYLPSYGFSAFDNLEFGEGYQIKMIEEVTDFQFCTTIAGGASQEELDAAIAEVHAIYDGWCESDVDNDGVCDIDEVSGCVESNACNYNVNATDDDGSCAFAFPFYDCSGLCLNDDNDNNICDELEVFGCMNETSCNYNELANMDDGSCEGLLGCTMEFFSEFNPDATCDDESCETVYACMDEASPNYQPGVELDAMMYGVFPIHDDSMCGQEGCMIEQGCNYDPSNEFGSIDLCEFPEEGFDCNGNIFNINELQIGDYYAGGIVYILNDDGTGWVVNPVQSIVWMTGGEYYEKINQANSNINYETNGDYGDWQLAGYNDYVTLSELFGPLSSEYPQFCNPGDYSWGFNDDNPNIMSDSQANFIFCDGSVQDVVWGWWFWPNVNYRLVRAF